MPKTQPGLARFVILTWSADGGAVTKAVSSAFGFKTYSVKQMIAIKENGKRHPQLWANALRPEGELFEARRAPMIGDKKKSSDGSNGSSGENDDSSMTTTGRLGGMTSQLQSYNKIALRLGVQETRSIDTKDLVEYDAIAGLPVSALPPSALLSIFPAYTKFVLVEGQQRSAEWCEKHVEHGVVPVLNALRAVTGEEDSEGNFRTKASASPTAKVWLSVLRHFAWPGSYADGVLETLPREQKHANVQSGFADSPLKAAMSVVSGATKDDGREVLTQVGDIRSVEARRKMAQAALVEWEREIKATIPPERLFVFREGADSWPELCYIFNELERLPTVVASKKTFPATSYGTDYMAYLRRQIARADIKMKLANIVAIALLLAVLWNLNSVLAAMGKRLVADAKHAVAVVDTKKDKQQEQQKKVEDAQKE